MAAVLALDVGGTKLAAAVVDDSGRVLGRGRVPSPTGTDPEALYEALLACAAAALRGAVAGLVGVALLAVDLRGAIGFSSTLVLVYYAVANAAAWTLGPAGRRWPRWRAGAGLAGCLLLAASLPAKSVLAGVAVLGAGAAAWAVRAARPSRDQPL